MRNRSWFRSAVLVVALAIAGLFAMTVPGSAVTEQGPARVPTAVYTITAPASPSGDETELASCQIFRFGPQLGAVGVFVEWDVFCDFVSPFFPLNGVLRAGANLVGANGTSCSGNSFCVLVVQSSGCLSGFSYQGRLDGAVQFPDGSIPTFVDLAPPNGAGVVVC